MIGKTVKVIVDRPLGTYHPKHKNIYYPVNYGYIEGIIAPDGYSIMQNGGKFNDVGHYHLHIFPRYVGDGFGWTDGSENIDVNKKIAEKIRDKMV